MKKVNVYHDGKLTRAYKATILSDKGKRKLIRFYDVIDECFEEDWFYKKDRKFGGSYQSVNHNVLFYPSRESDKFKRYLKSTVSNEYYDFLCADHGYVDFDEYMDSIK